eukprot:3143249-Amphidinium_carterae.1
MHATIFGGNGIPRSLKLVANVTRSASLQQLQDRGCLLFGYPTTPELEAHDDASFCHQLLKWLCSYSFPSFDLIRSLIFGLGMGAATSATKHHVMSREIPSDNEVKAPKKTQGTNKKKSGKIRNKTNR